MRGSKGKHIMSNTTAKRNRTLGLKGIAAILISFEIAMFLVLRDVFPAMSTVTAVVIALVTPAVCLLVAGLPAMTTGNQRRR